MKPMKKNTILILALIVLLIAGAVYYLSGGSSDGRGKGGETPVVVVKVYRQPLTDNIEALGTAYANESVTITASATETISEIHFTDSQEVKRGDVIARLEQREEQAQLGVAKAHLDEHKRELARIEALLKSKAASTRDFDERQTLIKVAQREIEEIGARIADRTLTAPFDGVLGIRRLSVGALVQPGAVITTLDDISLIKLDFTIPAMHLAVLKPGVAIEAVTDALNNEVFKGTIESVDTRVDPVTRSVLVRAILPNQDGRIKPGLLMQVKVLGGAREALVVPEESVLQRQDVHSVLVVNPDTLEVEARTIKIGTRIPGLVEAREGVQENELVIVRGVGRVQPGQKVTIKETWDTVHPPDISPGEK